MPPPIFGWGDEYLIVPPNFFICLMKFNSMLFSVYRGHCLSLSILLNVIHIQTRPHMLTQSRFLFPISCNVIDRLLNHVNVVKCVRIGPDCIVGPIKSVFDFMQ